MPARIAAKKFRDMEGDKITWPFRPKKIYCVRFSWYDDDPIRQEIVAATDVAGAWAKVQKKYPITAEYCHSITEIKPEEFLGEIKKGN